MVRLVIGIDVSKADFHACFRSRLETGTVKIVATHRFLNTEKGFAQLLEWTGKHNKEKQAVSFVMEATGVYYENLAYYLHEHQQSVSVVLANKMKAYFKSLNLKTKTDKVDAQVIALYGLERKLENWTPLSPCYKELRDCCRELLALKKDLQRAKSQLHAMNCSHQKHLPIVELKAAQIAFYEASIQQIQAALQVLITQHPALKAKIDKLTTIPGIGLETALLLASETNGFLLFTNSRQLVSYAGLDVCHQESGSFKGRSRISKKGNPRIRQALFMPALSAVRANAPIAKLYERVCVKNPEIKKKGVVAAMRKLLLVAFSVWKKDTEYNMAYNWTTHSATITNASGHEETKPSFGLFTKQKKSGAMTAPHKIDFSLMNQP